MRFRFDFTDSQGQRAARSYDQPLSSWTAFTPGQLPQLLAGCEAALHAGLHVAGFLSYEAAPAFDPVLPVQASDGSLPLAAFAAYERAGEAPEPVRTPYVLAPWQAEQTEAAYVSAVEEIRQRIAAGETYQVNYSTRLRSRLQGDAHGLYADLLVRQPAAYAALVETDTHTLLSLSPELFFRRAGTKITTRPMKGTIRRSADPVEDRQLQRELQASVKDRAENLMITDLLRNDLGRLALPGSVQVERLLSVESLPTFHALTSTVTAEIRPETSLEAILAALYPCGSITGAPKASTMGIIAGLESSPRGSYCGAIGFAEPGGDWVFNVAIRTLQLDKRDDSVVYGTGGGVTWDSSARGEYAEALLKASFLPGAPETWRQQRGRSLT